MQISAKIIADSTTKTYWNPDKQIRITTFELEYPRMIHSEFLTHRQFSRNAASSRARTVSSVLEQILSDPAMPVHWGKNQSGMQAKEELDEESANEVKELWRAASRAAVDFAKKMQEKNAHKQIINRILEPAQMIKVVMTTTEIENFFYLRNHPDAQPEIQELAKVMKEALDKSTPIILGRGEWHVPYFLNGFWVPGNTDYSIEDAISISASCCAQVSYRTLDQSLEKASQIYDRLVGMKPVHASPFEHQATPLFVEPNMLADIVSNPWPNGVTHYDVNGDFWSGNFRGWIQNRQLITGHVYNGEV